MLFTLFARLWEEVSWETDEQFDEYLCEAFLPSGDIVQRGS